MRWTSSPTACSNGKTAKEGFSLVLEVTEHSGRPSAEGGWKPCSVVVVERKRVLAEASFGQGPRLFGEVAKRRCRTVATSGDFCTRKRCGCERSHACFEEDLGSWIAVLMKVAKGRRVPSPLFPLQSPILRVASPSSLLARPVERCSRNLARSRDPRLAIPSLFQHSCRAPPPKSVAQGFDQLSGAQSDAAHPSASGSPFCSCRLPCRVSEVFLCAGRVGILIDHHFFGIHLSVGDTRSCASPFCWMVNLVSSAGVKKFLSPLCREEQPSQRHVVAVHPSFSPTILGPSLHR